MLDQACATCRFSRKDSSGDRNCHRDPPTSFLIPLPGKLNIEIKAYSSHPIVRDDDWCGSWAQRGDTTPLTRPD